MKMNCLRLTHLVFNLIIASLLFTAPVYGNTPTENMDLARISHILDASYPIIEDAKKQADPNQRLKFHYEWLKEDIQSIQKGIAQKIKQDRIEPRVITPLKTKYTTARNGHQ